MIAPHAAVFAMISLQAAVFAMLMREPRYSPKDTSRSLTAEDGECVAGMKSDTDLSRDVSSTASRDDKEMNYQFTSVTSGPNDEPILFRPIGNALPAQEVCYHSRCGKRQSKTEIRNPTTLEPCRRTVIHWRILVMLATSFIWGWSNTAAYVLLPEFVEERAGLTQSQTGNVYLFGGISGILSRPLVGILGKLLRLVRGIGQSGMQKLYVTSLFCKNTHHQPFIL